MTYRSSFSSPWSGRASPYTSTLRQDDRSFSDLYEYVDAGEVDPRGGGRGSTYRTSGSELPPPFEDDTAPDIIHIRHLNQAFHLQFPAYSISESAITAGEVRQEVARHLGQDQRRIRLVYKDRDLRRDHRPIKHYGCKQNSEIVVVITEILNERGDTHSSEEDIIPGTPIYPTQTNDRRRPRGNSSVRDRVEEVHETPQSGGFLHPLNGYSQNRRRSPSYSTTMERTRSHSPAPQASSSRDTNSGPAPAPAPSRSPPRVAADPNSPMGKVQALEDLFNDKWLPESERFLASPPYDPRERDKEQKRLGECVMRYIIEAADAIELQGDRDARQERKKVLDRANELVKRLDNMPK